MKTFSDVEVLLAERLPNYESRRPQQIGAAAVEKAIAEYRHLLLQAGTGVGKSFMGSIPAILSGNRVVISTATKALQSQIVSKDIPFLKEHLPEMPFTWALLQGRSNYVCRNRTDLVAKEDAYAREIIAFLNENPDVSGLRENFPFEIPASTWSKCCSETEECRELRCKDLGGCYALVARERARDAQVVVVNHALLCTDLVLLREADFSMLGDYQVVVVDEVHELVDYAKSALGQSFTEGSISGLTSQVRNFVHNFLDHYDNKVAAAEAEVLGARQMLWLAFQTMMRPAERGKPAPTTLRLKASMFTDYEAEWLDMVKALRNYANLLLSMPTPVDDPKASRRWKLLVSRANRVASRFQNLALCQPDTVSWLEVQTRKAGDTHIVIQSQPIMVDDWLRENLFDRATFVGMSATCEVGGSFSFLAKRMGLRDFDGLDVGTMFDYPNQALLCIPRNFPQPTGRTYNEWAALVPQAIHELITASSGRALLLFTSKRQMEQVYKAVSPLVHYKCLKQGDAPVPVLTREFRENTHSVLFATRSFMTGIDIQGESLSLVVLDKLVFDTPDDPVFEAECEVVEARGGSAFTEVSMPKMLLVVQQAAGRLIRTQADRGVFVVLDSRIHAKSYGAKVKRALPPMTFVDSLTAVSHFFGPQAPVNDGDFDEDAFNDLPSTSSASAASYDEPF